MIPRAVVGIALLLLPLAAPCASRRFARVGEFEGKPEVQVHAADPWQPALRNMTLLESSWIRTPAGARLEIEIDEGSALRLAGDSLAEISDCALLSTGQRITLISLDHGLAYFTGEPRPGDTLSIAAPAAQITLRQGSRVRVESSDQWSQVSVFEGRVRLSMATAEIDLTEGQVARVEAAGSGHFALYREIPQIDSDHWSEERDKAAAHTTSAKYLVGTQYGLLDLDRNGTWIHTSGKGMIWKPKVAADWAPFQDGRWQWYEELGYTWVAGESWGWAPYHYGRWLQDSDLGWVWVPGDRMVFKPGEVYWMRGANLAAWGPLAPGEIWTGAGPPPSFAGANTSVAKFAAGMKEFAPDFAAAKPKDLLAAAAFTVALPSPPLPASRLDAPRPALRAGSTRPLPSAPVVEFAQPVQVSRAVPESNRPEVLPAPVQSQPTENAFEQPQPQNIIAPEPVEVYYPVPVYEGIVVLNPPEREHREKKSAASTPPAHNPDPPHSNIATHQNEDHRPQHVAAPPPAASDSDKNSSDKSSDTRSSGGNRGP